MLLNPYTFAGPFVKVITIDHTKCGSTDSTNFPVLILGTYSYLATVANGGAVKNSSGYDIQFYSDSALTSPLKFERESYNASTGAVIFWVKVPTLSASTDTVIYMAYGNSAVTTDQQDVANTWDSNFKGVWHLGDGSTLGLSDSTSNGNTLTNVNTATATTGKVGGGVNLSSASSQYLKVASQTGLKNQSFTLSAWVYLNSTSGAFAVFGWSNSPVGGFAGWNYIRMASSGKINLLASDAVSKGISNTAISSGGWYHIAVTNASNGDFKFYLNGAADGNGNETTAYSWPSGFYPTIGVDYNSGPVDYYDGKIDEVKYSATIRSADWIAAEYNNQNSPSTFYTIN
jgi:hypothetical protein